MTPLGERGRGNRWAATAAWYVLGGAAGGAAVGALLGTVGLALRDVLHPSGATALAFLAAVAVLGMALDAGLAGTRLPSVRRQVNEDWLRRYRGWVYGVGFGFQLGAAFFTVVSASAVYAAFLAALLSRSPLGGTVIGGVFGLARGLSILSVAGVRGHGQLVRVDARLRRWDRPARAVALLAEAMLALIPLFDAGPGHRPRDRSGVRRC